MAEFSTPRSVAPRPFPLHSAIDPPMTIAANSETPTVDVIVVGSGAGGLATAVTAAAKGLSVVVLEKAAVFGGTTARSGGVLWVPGNGHFPDGPSPADADPETYLRHEAGNAFDADRVRAFLSAAPRMLAFMESGTSAVRFIPAHGFSDYHPHAPGAVTTGRSIAAEPYDGTSLGREVQRLRPPLAEITLLGMMLNASQDVKHLFNATRSVKSFWHVVKLVGRYGRDLLIHRRAMRLTNGNALIARLARSAFDLGVEIRTSASVTQLTRAADGRVTGVVVNQAQQIIARRGVVLAAGGFPLDQKRRRSLFPHEIQGGEHLSPAAEGNTGDGIALGEAAGASFRTDISNAAAWIPVSVIPDARQRRVFPHLIDRYKPGVIMVNRLGNRFTNEADSYHDVGQAMIRDRKPGEEVFAWLVSDHRAIRKYGLGFAKPAPFPLSPYVRSGYLKMGRTIRELATTIGVDADTLERTLEHFNTDAAQGQDSQFHRGQSAYNRYLGDAEHRPNPCVAPLATAPFYAIRLVLGDLGTFAGMATDQHARVLKADRSVIPGLFAVGNDALSIMGGGYPGGGITLGPAMTFGFLAAEYLANSSPGNHVAGQPAHQESEHVDH